MSWIFKEDREQHYSRFYLDIISRRYGFKDIGEFIEFLKFNEASEFKFTKFVNTQEHFIYLVQFGVPLHKLYRNDFDVYEIRDYNQVKEKLAKFQETINNLQILLPELLELVYLYSVL